SSGPGSGTGTSSIRSGSWYPYILAARICITCASLSLAGRKRLGPCGLGRNRVLAPVTAAPATDSTMFACRRTAPGGEGSASRGGRGRPGREAFQPVVAGVGGHRGAGALGRGGPQGGWATR